MKEKTDDKPKWNKDTPFRTTKCFGAWTPKKNGAHYNGAFPAGFLKWIKKMGWWGVKRCHLCAGMIEDPGSVRVDIKPETEPTIIADARDTKLEDNTFDFVTIDPPYSRDLADKLYGTAKHFTGIDGFAKEAVRICKPGGLILTLSYQIPRRLKDCDFIAVCGIYTIPSVSYMRCLTVSKKKARALERGE